MCLKFIDVFTCTHRIYYNHVEKCPDWDNANQGCSRLRTEDYHHGGQCPGCNQPDPIEKFWYKHCYQSKICDHEYDHMLTDAERDPRDDDIVLVTPNYGLCPECTQAGYDEGPGGDNTAPKTASVMPRDFEDLPRMEIDQVKRVSKIPNSSLRPWPPSKLGGSRLSSNAYNPGASRVPPSRRSENPSRTPSRNQGNSQDPSPSQYARESQRPPSSQVPRESQRPSQSHAPSASKIGASKRPSPPSSIYARTRAPPAGEEGPELEVLLNSATITPLSHYDDEPLSPAGSTAYPGKSSAGHGSSAAPKYSEAISQSKMIALSSVARSEVPRQSQMASYSNIAGGSHVLRSEISRDSRMTSQSKVVVASSVAKSEVPRHSQMLSQSKLPSLCSVSKYPQDPSGSKTLSSSPRHSLLSYHTESESKKLTATMSPAELLKRGPPNNVNASTFYDNPDGEEAKAKAEGRGQSSRPSGDTAPKSSTPRGEAPERRV